MSLWHGWLTLSAGLHLLDRAGLSLHVEHDQKIEHRATNKLGAEVKIICV